MGDNGFMCWNKCVYRSEKSKLNLIWHRAIKMERQVRIQLKRFLRLANGSSFSEYGSKSVNERMSSLSVNVFGKN